MSKTTYVKDKDGHTIGVDVTDNANLYESITTHYEAEDTALGVSRGAKTGRTGNNSDGTSHHIPDGKCDSMCFLTTACVEHAGLKDDCHELMVLRSFRDHYVATLPDGTAILAEYYRVAPAIVHCINQSINRDADLAKVFKIVSEAVSMIESSNDQQALALYRDMFTDLKYRYQVA